MQIECRIDQLVNLLAALQAQPELVATSDLRVLSSNAKEKTVAVRLTVSGVVPRRLVPEKSQAGEEGRRERIVNRRIVLLNLALLALAGALVWILRANWLEAQARERAVLQRKVAPKAVLAPPPLPGVKAVAPAEYIDVASKMLFSKDRNPTVVVEPPKPAPEPVMPALPNYHGQMAIGEPVIFLSVSANAVQRSYHAGDQVGDFKLVSFDEDRVDFEWKGKNIERKLEELRPKETTGAGGAQAARPRLRRPRRLPRRCDR